MQNPKPRRIDITKALTTAWITKSLRVVTYSPKSWITFDVQ